MDSIYNFFFEHALYLVMVIVMIIWIGIFFYMNGIDRRLKKLENKD